MTRRAGIVALLVVILILAGWFLLALLIPYIKVLRDLNIRVGITIIVALALFGLMISIIILTFVIASEFRRIARKELSNIVRSNLVHNPVVAERLFSEVLFHCVQEKRYELVTQINITDYFINHYVDFRFNYRVYNNLLVQSRETKSLADLREVAKLAQAIDSWRAQAESVSKQLHDQIVYYSSLNTKFRTRLAIKYVERRPSHFLAAVQKFVSDTKEVSVNALSNDIL